MINTEYINNSISRLYGTTIKSEPNGRTCPHRLLAWERCYRYFCSNKETLQRYMDSAGALKNPANALPDTPMLHLATYLANWGMYADNNFLLKADYTIFDGVVAELLKKDYNSLWAKDNDLDAIAPFANKRPEFAEKLIAVKKRTREIWVRYPADDLLLTKILMATCGIILAYDRFVCNGLARENIGKTFGKKSINGLLDFYLDNKAAFDKPLPLRINHPGQAGGPVYPIMRKMDMFFFVHGGALNQK